MLNASRRQILLNLVLDEDALPLASQQQQVMSSVAMAILLNSNWHGAQQGDSREDIDDVRSILCASPQSVSFQRKMIAVHLLHAQQLVPGDCEYHGRRVRLLRRIFPQHDSRRVSADVTPRL
jgi:hypothetical protein